MRGDKHKPQSKFSRWIESFMDGSKRTTRTGSKRIPSLVDEKRYERRWRRRKEREDLKEQIYEQRRNRRKD